MNYLGSISGVLGQRKYSLAFLFSFVVFVALLSITSGFFLLQMNQINPLADPAKVAITASIAVLLAVNVAFALHNYDMRARNSAGKASLGGAAAAFFTTSCAVCQPAWFFWIGLGAWTGFLADLSIYIGFLSIGLLLFSIKGAIESSAGLCKVKK